MRGDTVLFWMVVVCGCACAHYTPQWAVHITGGPQVADRVAAEHGFINLGQILTDYYHFVGRGVAKRSIEPHGDRQARLDSDTRVHWAQQQRIRSRQKRDLIPLVPPKTFKLQQQTTPQPKQLLQPQLTDQKWPQMWYLNRGSGLDMNVVPAWKEGVTGKGVVVTILDDGLEKDHPDLVKNYDPLASYDVNNHDEDPMPRYDIIDSNRHGTRCAGEVAATANNTICAVGVAFGANVGGVRMLDGDVTDAVEARSLSLNPQHIDIYSASWGPDDDGKTVDGPGELATRAFIEGVTKGRGGKGSIFVWASGNGGRDHDNCNCDGYTNSIWTLSISSATESGHVPWYSEACSSTLATTYSSGSLGEKQVITTDLHHSCTSSHTGTSASAPLAAGICALALESNPNLTWRDMQHIVVRTARPANLNANDWQVNGVGRNVSHSFGYGLMDASAMVRLARTWKTVPDQHKCEVSAQILDPTIPAKSRKKFSLVVKDCPGVNYLEHLQAKISLATFRRGDLEINLTSPAGTRSTLLAHRSHDFSRQGFMLWPFMSVHTWGEQPFGEWKLEIHNEGRTLNRATLQNWSLILYGTSEPSDKNIYYSLPNPYVPSRTNTTQSKQGKGKNKTIGKPPYANPKKTKNPKNKNQKNKVTVRPETILKGISSKPKIYKPGSDPTTDNPRNFIRYSKTKKGNQKTVKNTGVLVTTVSSYKLPTIFQQYPKAQHVYPALYPKSESADIMNENYPVSQFNPDYGIISDNGRASPKNSETSRDTDGPNRKGKKYTHESGEIRGSLNITPDNLKTPAPISTKAANVQREKPTEHATTINDADLHEWNLVLYGTTTLPGEDEIESKTTLTAQNDYEHNSIDASSSDQWREEPQVRDETNHVEVHRTTTDDMTNSACSRNDGQTCLECTKGTYLHQGKCVSSCPPQYYPVQLSTNSKKPSNNNTRVRPRDEKIKTAKKQICQQCHYSCLQCNGPNDYECTKCYGDAILTNVTTTDTYCYPSSLASNLNNVKWFYRTYLVLLIVIALFLIMCLVLFVQWTCKKIKGVTKNSKKIYSRVNISDLDPPKDMENQISNALQTASDTD